MVDGNALRSPQPSCIDVSPMSSNCRRGSVPTLSPGCQGVWLKFVGWFSGANDAAVAFLLSKLSAGPCPTPAAFFARQLKPKRWLPAN